MARPDYVGWVGSAASKYRPAGAVLHLLVKREGRTHVLCVPGVPVAGVEPKFPPGTDPKDMDAHACMACMRRYKAAAWDAAPRGTKKEVP